MSRRPCLGGRPVLIVDRGRPGGGPVVVDWFPGVSGVAVGMPLQAAVSCQADAVVLDADEPFYRRVFGGVMASLRGVSDRVEAAELGVAYARLDGLERLYGGEGGVAAALLGAVPGYLGPRAGVGDGKFPAFVAASRSGPLAVTEVPDDVRGFLAPCSVDVLPVPSGVKAGMRRLGLHTLGEVASIGAGFLVERFGHEGRRAWDLSRGVDERLLVASGFEEPVVESVVLPFASTSLGLLLRVVDTLLEQVFSQPQMRGRRARRAILSCVLSQAPLWEKSVRFKQGVGSWERAASIVKRQLEADHPRAPVQEAAVVLADLTGESGTQMTLLDDRRDDRRRRLAGLVEVAGRLRAQAGGEHVLYRLADVAPWHPVPELQAVQVPIDPSGKDTIKPVSLPARVAVREGTGQQPVAVHLGRRWHRVARIEERWCFDLWWMPEPVSRVYYRVGREDGLQVTLFRDQQSACWYRQRI